MNIEQMKARNKRLIEEHDRLNAEFEDKYPASYRTNSLAQRRLAQRVNRLWSEALALYQKIKKIDPEYEGY